MQGPPEIPADAKPQYWVEPSKKGEMWLFCRDGALAATKGSGATNVEGSGQCASLCWVRVVLMVYQGNTSATSFVSPGCSPPACVW